MMKKRAVAKRADVAPTGMLDAYTEGPANSAMSDSAKFKEGYVKKGKGKQKNPPKKIQTEDDAEIKEEPEEKESWDEDVVESWDQLEVEQMPVPQKVKQEMRREEKKRKKEQEKSKTVTEKTPENQESSKSSDSEKKSSAEPEVEKHKSPVPVPVLTEVRAKNNSESDDIVKAVKQLTLGDSKSSSDKQEVTVEDQAAIKAEREAKKAAKAAQKAAAKNKGKSTGVDIVEEKPPVEAQSQNQEVESESKEKTKEELKAERKAQFEQKSKVESGVDSAAEKSKAELKAERRAKQEAQRLAKTQSQEQKQKPESKIRVPDEIKADDKKTEKKLLKTLNSQNVPVRTKAQRQVGLFSHLHQYEREVSVTRNLPVVGGSLHPAIIQLGIQYAEGEIVGSSGRCVSLLLALRTLLLDLVPQLNSTAELYKEIDNIMKPNITFLKQCRPLSISMSNAIRYLKREVMGFDRNLSLEEVRTSIEEMVDDFININFTLHPKAISETANKKIRDGDVILTYSHSKLVEKVLLDAAAQGKKIKVIVADGRVQNLGRSLCPGLVAAGIHSTYILLSALSQVLPTVTKVLLGCDGVMANGCVLANVGTSQVALLAKSYNKPVVVCCETYKFTERVQTDSFVYNELSDPDDLVSTGRPAQPLADWRDLSSLCLLNLVYDLTPASLVDSIITEISEIPPTSVPVVLRLHNMGDPSLSMSV
eukprot:GFUD01104087.1.p1 GENE.GFUD01104087.1~~GFUD01104087.1.p1  ORF type:complete len:725 (+),score=224.08 GFUD01104087.1:61-2175(+)